MSHLTRREVAELEDYPEWVARPKTRGDCEGDARPCPFVSCKYHLYLDVNPVTGHVKYNFPGLEVWELACSCSLDVADGGYHTLEEVADRLGLVRERIRQIELVAVTKVRRAVEEGRLLCLSRDGDELD
jgi:hypothetical protein